MAKYFVQFRCICGQFLNFSSLEHFKAKFAQTIPEIVDLIGSHPKYNGWFTSQRGRR